MLRTAPITQPQGTASLQHLTPPLPVSTWGPSHAESTSLTVPTSGLLSSFVCLSPLPLQWLCFSACPPAPPHKSSNRSSSPPGTLYRMTAQRALKIAKLSHSFCCVSFLNPCRGPHGPWGRVPAPGQNAPVPW